MFDVYLGADIVATELRQRIDLLRRQFHLFVFEQAAHQLGARVLGLFAGIGFPDRQQHARFDFDQHRRHQQVFRRQLQIVHADLVDVLQVLLCDLRHRDIEDVEVLLADQVQQQIERTLECFQEDFQRVGRDI